MAILVDTFQFLTDKILPSDIFYKRNNIIVVILLTTKRLINL